MKYQLVKTVECSSPYCSQKTCKVDQPALHWNMFYDLNTACHNMSVYNEDGAYEPKCDCRVEVREVE